MLCKYEECEVHYIWYITENCYTCKGEKGAFMLFNGKESTCQAGDLGLILGLERNPGEENAAHCSILTWEIPWTEDPGGLQSIGSQRVRHDLATEHTTL